MADSGQRVSRATIDDVAREAVVHRSTVSRALRGDVRITPETRDRIQRIADTLHYEPNLLAKGLAGYGSGTIGILTPRLRDGFYVTIVSRQQELLIERGFSPLMGVTQGGLGPQERRAIKNLVNRGVDGLIVNHVPGYPETNAMLMQLATGGLPIGMLGIHHLKGIDCVGYDTSAMVEEIVRHLLGLGHRRIGISLRPRRPLSPSMTTWPRGLLLNSRRSVAACLTIFPLWGLMTVGSPGCAGSRSRRCDCPKRP